MNFHSNFLLSVYNSNYTTFFLPKKSIIYLNAILLYYLMKNATNTLFNTPTNTLYDWMKFMQVSH